MNVSLDVIEDQSVHTGHSDHDGSSVEPQQQEKAHGQRLFVPDDDESVANKFFVPDTDDEQPPAKHDHISGPHCGPSVSLLKSHMPMFL